MNDSANEDTGLDPETAQALEQQQQLAETALEAVFEAYDEAIAEGVETPVVIVIDCEDPLGAEISRAWLGDEVVDDAIAMQQAEDEGEEDATTIFTVAFAFEQCRDEVPKVFPYLAEVFASAPPTEGVLMVSITSGGASALTAPMDARP